MLQSNWDFLENEWFLLINIEKNKQANTFSLLKNK